MRAELDAATVEVYEQHAAEWKAARTPTRLDQAAQLATRVAAAAQVDPEAAGLPVLDLGCGPGWYAGALGPYVVALDVARSMLDLAGLEAPLASRVQADLARLPFARGGGSGRLGLQLLRPPPRHRAPTRARRPPPRASGRCPVAARPVRGRRRVRPGPRRHPAGTGFSAWPTDRLRDVVVGAGFTVESADAPAGRPSWAPLVVSATRARTLPDTVGPGMRLLICGLNPSVYSADVGIGFARNGNRYWPAALAAGLVSVDRDPRHALRHHGIGMTDLVKRATPRADELTAAEYGAGLDRVDRLCAWLRPGAVCFVGLAGWRAAADRKAVAGVQPDRLGGTPGLRHALDQRPQRPHHPRRAGRPPPRRGRPRRRPRLTRTRVAFRLRPGGSTQARHQVRLQVGDRRRRVAVTTRRPPITRIEPRPISNPACRPVTGRVPEVGVAAAS